MQSSSRRESIRNQTSRRMTEARDDDKSHLFFEAFSNFLYFLLHLLDLVYLGFFVFLVVDLLLQITILNLLFD
jgi:hypothetical protein